MIEALVSGCVLDASAIVPAFSNSPRTPQSHAIVRSLETAAAPVHTVPSFFFIEVANALWKTVQFAGVPRSLPVRVIDRLIDFPLQVVDTFQLTKPALDLALDFKITTYDALYLALSVQTQLPLITAYRDLLKITDPRFQIINLTDIEN